MNIVDILILVILGYGLLAGMYKGSITSLLSVLSFVAAWFGAMSLYQSIANFALSNSTLMAVLNQYLEPESFFTSTSQAALTVSEVVESEATITAVVEAISENFSFLADAFSLNVRTEAFAALGITTVSDYLNQTLWEAVFNVLAFLAAFVVIYLVLSFIVNMLDKVISFPVLRGFDWLVGGILGLLKCSVIVVLILNILPVITSVISEELTTQLISESVLYTFASQFDLLNVSGLFETLIMG